MPYRKFSDLRLADYDGNKIVTHAYKNHITDFHISVIGRVTKVLPDDTIGIPHQRFLIQLPQSNQTILVVHNLDYGKRLHLEADDVMKVTGEYVWNQHGGLIHLTHHDPNRAFEPGSAAIIEEIHADPKPTVTPPRQQTKMR
jgi:hypothetical protein